MVFDPKRVSYDDLLKVVFESHDPTQGIVRHLCHSPNAPACAAEAAKRAYEPALVEKGFDAITTEILPAPIFYFAESYHQQYLAKHPHGYCGLGGTGGVLPDRHGRQRGGLAKRGRWRSV